MDKYYVYEWYNIDTAEVFYVGKGIRNRYCQISGRNQFFLDYFNSHNCSSRKIFENLSEEQAYFFEIKMIKFYRENSDFRLTNVCDGGEGHPFLCGDRNPKFKKGYLITGKNNPFYGKTHSPRTREILSERAKEKVGNLNSFYGRSHSEKTKNILSEKAKQRFRIKENNPMYGKTHTKEVREKISVSRLGKSLPDVTKNKISNTLKEKYQNSIHFNLGRKHSEESKLKMSKNRIGENNPNWRNGEKIRGEKNPMYGKTHNNESKFKMKLAAQNRKFHKKCFRCSENFISKAHNAKYCSKCRK